MKTLWDRIEIAMSAAAVNMAETARRAEIRPNTLTNWKSGKTERPRRNDIEKVARVLGVSPDWLMTGEGPMPPRPSG
jgi:HTH-type transcriptional regulator, cell division transcriptional repressor